MGFSTISKIAAALILLLLAGCGGGGSGAGAGAAPNTNGSNSSVAYVTSLVATPGDAWVSLSWVNPTSAFAGVMVRRDITCPANPTLGTLVSDTTGTTALDTGLANGTNYCYTVFVHDSSGSYSAGHSAYAKPAASYAAIPAGGIHSLGIKSDGTLWGWGYNAMGQLGDGCVFGTTCFDSPTPKQVGIDATWTAVSAGTAHSVALKGGTLWSWGDNSSDQIGSGCPASTCSYISTPTQITTAANWASVSAGGFFTVAIKTDGTLWAWGENFSGQLGDGCSAFTFACAKKSTPTQIGTATNWAAVAAGAMHVVALKTDGTIWAWGNNNAGQLGYSTGVNPYNSTPTQIGTATDWKSISAGDTTSFAIKTNGTLWAWGNNSSGQLGITCATNCGWAGIPTQVGIDTNWKVVDGGYPLTIALKTDGTLWTWGAYATSTGAYSSVPLQVGTGTSWSNISAGGGGGSSGIGGGHFLALESTPPSGHRLLSWGAASLGRSTGTSNWIPGLVN